MQEKMNSAISAAAMDKLIAAHDGDVALLYIYICRTGCRDMDRAAHDLCRTLREVSAAEEKLRRMGLLNEESEAPPLRASEDALPEYSAEDMTKRASGDPGFSIILEEAKRVMGRSLSSNDMKILFGIYDYLGLPVEVILELMNYCAEVITEKFGSGRRPSARAIEKEAYAWSRQEIMTLEMAEDYIHRQKQRREGANRLKTLLGIGARELSATELKHISSWLEMGFEDEAIAIAFDRTVTNTGALKWPYMNKILQSWHERGLHTAEEIEQNDGRSRPQSPVPRRETKPVDIDALKNILENI